MDIKYTSSDDDAPSTQQRECIGTEAVSFNRPTVASSTALMEKGPSTSVTESTSASQASPSTAAASTLTDSITVHANLLENHSILFANRRLEMVTEYYNNFGLGPSRSDWTDQRRCHAVSSLYLLCTSLMTTVRIVEAVLRISLGNNKLVEAPRIWKYFTMRLQDIQQRAALVDPSLFPNYVKPSPVVEEPVTCRICRHNSPNILFAPCGHMVCRACSDKLEVCPICRGGIACRFKAYF